MYSCVSCLSHLLWRVNLCSTFRGIALPLIWVSLPHKCFGSTIYYINISSKGRHGYHPPQTLRTNPPYTPTWSDGLFSLLHFGLLLFPLLTGRLILRWPLITISYHLHQFCTRAAQGAFIASQPDSWGKAFLPILLHFYFYQNKHIFQNYLYGESVTHLSHLTGPPRNQRTWTLPPRGWFCVPALQQTFWCGVALVAFLCPPYLAAKCVDFLMNLRNMTPPLVRDKHEFGNLPFSGHRLQV